MLNSTKTAMLAAIKKHMTENGHNLESIQDGKRGNPYPFSQRWVSSIVESIRLNDGRNFSKKKCIKALNFIGVAHKFNEEGMLVLCEKSN